MKLFDPGPCTDVTLAGDYGMIVLLPYSTVRSMLAEYYSEPEGPSMVEVPVLLHDGEGEEFTVELGLFRMDLVSTVVTWRPKNEQAEAAGTAIGEAMRDFPQHFEAPRPSLQVWGS